MTDNLKRNAKALGMGFVCLIAGMVLASLITYPIRQGIYSAPENVTAWFRDHGAAAMAVEWVPAFLHGLVAGVVGMLGGLRFAKGASALALAVMLAATVTAMTAYSLWSAGDRIGLFVRGTMYLEALGCFSG